MFHGRISWNHGGERLGCSSDQRYLIQVVLTVVWGWNRARLLRKLLKLWNICMTLSNAMCYDCLQTLYILFFNFFLIFIFTLFYFTILYWFCHTLTWIHHGCTWVSKHEPPSHLPSHIISLDHWFKMYNVEQVSQHYTF